MTESTVTRRSLLATFAAMAAVPLVRAAECRNDAKPSETKETGMKSWHGREAIRQNLRAFADKGADQGVSRLCDHDPERSLAESPCGRP
jgi:hypothetical protein